MEKALRLGEMLIAEGVISHQQLLESLKIQEQDGRKLGDILVQRGFVSDRRLVDALAKLFALPTVFLEESFIEEKVLNLVPVDLIKKHKVIPLDIQDGHLRLATHDPLDLISFQEVQYASGYQVKPVVASLKDIEKYLTKLGNSLKAMAVLQDSKGAGAQSTSVIQLVESFLIKAIQERASDIHLEPQEMGLRVRFRIDGELYEKSELPTDLARKVVSRIKIISGMDVADSRRPQDGRMSLPEHLSNHDVRVSTLPGINGENVVLRILSKSFENFSLDSLGMSSEEIAQIEELIKKPHGMILVTGPTGAGKTTTLYSFLHKLNQVSKNIITVEDPVEYRLPGINQTAINNLSGYTFATAIRHILRHDPDIIMVGEIRDVETAEIAIRAALTGHLVLSTLHTNSAAGAIMRLLDMSVEPFLIRSALIGVLAQRLVRRLCPKCKKTEKIQTPYRQELQKNWLGPVPEEFALASGCQHCFMTGYAGREAVYEILPIHDTIKNLILESPNEKEITRLAMERGMKTLRQNSLEKATRKLISLEEAMRMTLLEDE